MRLSWKNLSTDYTDYTDFFLRIKFREVPQFMQKEICVICVICGYF